MTKGFVKFVWADAVSVPSAFDGLMGYARLNGSNHFKQHQTTSKIIIEI